MTNGLVAGTTQPGILKYTSKYQEHKHLNGRAISTDSREGIWCRHLAYTFATCILGTKETGKFSSIDSVDKIETHRDIINDAQYSAKFEDRQSDEGYYFGRDSLRVALKLALKHQPEENKPRRYMLMSAVHAMAIMIEPVKKSISIKLAFYDPNSTLCVQMLIVPSVELLESLIIDDFLEEHLVNAYFSNSAFFT